jgi:sulfide dehydrogenase [flavocytochrome c] flavoprotein subunit
VLDRRTLLQLSALGLGALAVPARAFAQAVPKIVVLGGGAGGATAAGLVRRFGGPRVEITLIEQNAAYVTCFFSNWVLGGLRSMADITHGYDRLAASGIKIVNARADAVDREGKAVVLADGTRVPYDRLILSPGVDFDFGFLPGYGQDAIEVMPHAWKAGPQTELLKARLDALSDGATIVMTVPDNPYRCPPGPYERVSMFAHALKARGHARSKIVVLDGKEKFSKQALFQEGWEAHYPGMVEWLPPSVHGGLQSADPAAGTITTALDSFRGDLVNVIPPQRAGAVAVAAGLADDKGWCAVLPGTFQSKADPSVYVIGDAAKAGEMPKSAFSANSQGKLAAMRVLVELVGRETSDPLLFNTCWSLIAPDDGVKVGALYGEKDGAIVAKTPFVSQPGEPAEERRRSVAEAEAWYAAITADMFG